MDKKELNPLKPYNEEPVAKNDKYDQIELWLHLYIVWYYVLRGEAKNFSENSLLCEYTCKTCGRKGM